MKLDSYSVYNVHLDSGFMVRWYTLWVQDHKNVLYHTKQSSVRYWMFFPLVLGSYISSVFGSAHIYRDRERERERERERDVCMYV